MKKNVFVENDLFILPSSANFDCAYPQFKKKYDVVLADLV
jgi:hypothetical protein